MLITMNCIFAHIGIQMTDHLPSLLIWKLWFHRLTVVWQIFKSIIPQIIDMLFTILTHQPNNPKQFPEQKILKFCLRCSKFQRNISYFCPLGACISHGQVGLPHPVSAVTLLNRKPLSTSTFMWSPDASQQCSGASKTVIQMSMLKKYSL